MYIAAWPPKFCDTFDTFLYHISVVLGRKLLFPKSPVFSVVLRSMDTAQHFSRRSATVLSCSLLQRDFSLTLSNNKGRVRILFQQLSS